MLFNKLLRWSALFLIALLMGACVKKVNHVDMAAHKKPYNIDDISQAMKRADIQIGVSSINDERLEKQYLAKLPHTTVFGDNFSGWIQARFDEFKSASSENKPVARIDVAVKKAYIRLLPSSLGASVVMDVGYTCENRPELTHQLYRGDSTTVNWAFGHSEIMGALNKSMTQLMVKMIQDIDVSCGRNQVSSR